MNVTLNSAAEIFRKKKIFSPPLHEKKFLIHVKIHERSTCSFNYFSIVQALKNFSLLASLGKFSPHYYFVFLRERQKEI